MSHRRHINAMSIVLALGISWTVAAANGSMTWRLPAGKNFPLVGGNWGNSADLAEQFLAKAILLAVVIFGVRRIMRFNILGCFLIIAGTFSLAGASELLGQPDAFYRVNGCAVLVALFLLLAWPFTSWRIYSRGT